MRALSFFVPVTLLVLSACVSTGSGPVDIVSEEAEIFTVLETQQTAWNTGDIPGFMEGYWKSEELRFASGGSITYGWQATLDRYLTSYDSPEKMGELTLSCHWLIVMTRWFSANGSCSAWKTGHGGCSPCISGKSVVNG